MQPPSPTRCAPTDTTTTQKQFFRNLRLIQSSSEIGMKQTTNWFLIHDSKQPTKKVFRTNAVSRLTGSEQFLERSGSLFRNSASVSKS